MNETTGSAVRAPSLPEGEERLPAGVRTAALVRWSLVGLMAAAAMGAWVYHAATGGVLVEQARFQCPMHPTVVQLRPGECPICGMDLVPARAAGAHPEPAAHPAGPAAAPTPADAGAAALYTCPMHPAFVTADPKARCPDCGMKLSPREPAAGAAAPAGVPGLAAVDLTNERIQLMGLRTAPARRGPLATALRLPGFVTAPEGAVVSVTARNTGWVETVKASETGQRVDRGQVLASVYSPDLVTLQQTYLNAIRWNDARGSTPAPAGTSPASGSVERDARQRLELGGMAPVDVDEIARTAQVLRAVPVRSPVRGFVARRGIVRGAYLQPGTELFQLADLGSVWVIADAHEADLARVKVGQKATVEVAGLPGRRFQGKVQFVYPALNTGSRTLQARIVLPNPQLELRPGMYADVTVEADALEALVVPREALVDTGEHQYVFVARGGGRYEPRRVRAGEEAEGRVSIVAGLAEGEQVVSSATFLLDSESRLRAAADPAAVP